MHLSSKPVGLSRRVLGSSAPKPRFRGHHPEGAGREPQKAGPRPQPRRSPRGKALRVTRCAQHSQNRRGGRARQAQRAEPKRCPEGRLEGNPGWTIGLAAAGGTGRYQPAWRGGGRRPVPAAAQPLEGARRCCRRRCSCRTDHAEARDQVGTPLRGPAGSGDPLPSRSE